MSNTPNKLELEYLKALGYKKPTTISNTNKPLVGKMIKYKIPLNHVSRNALKNNYKDLPDKPLQKFPNKPTKAQFIDKLINTYIENSKAEIINEDEDKFVDAQERIIPKPNFNSNEIPNVNNNLSKMSRGVTFNQRRAVPLGSLDDFMNMPVKNNAVKNHNEAMLTKSAPIWNTTYDYSAKHEHPDYAAAYAKKIGGKAFRADINGDKTDDIIITNKSGRIKYVNGHTIKPSTRGKDLDYYDSDHYKNAPFEHKTASGKTVKDLFGKYSRAEYNKTLTPEAKKNANKLLRETGFATYQVKEKTLNKILKESASELYKNVIETIVARHENVNKTKLKQQLPMSRFETLIVNAILLKMYNADFNKSKSYLDQLVSNLKKVWNNDKQYKNAIIEHANSAIDALSNTEVLDQLAEPLYKITLKDSKHGEIYQAIIKLIGKGVTFNQQIIDYYTSEVGQLDRARLDKTNAARKEYYEKNPDKKPKSKKAKKAKKTTEKPVLEELDPELIPKTSKKKSKVPVFESSEEELEDF